MARSKRHLTCEDVGLLAAKEEQVDKNFIETMLGDGVDDMKSAGKKVAVKRNSGPIAEQSTTQTEPPRLSTLPRPSTTQSRMIMT